MLIIFVNIAWRAGFPEMPDNQYYPLLQGARAVTADEFAKSAKRIARAAA
jgi:hypothetical protein